MHTTSCPLCSDATEMTDHVLVHCAYTYEIWKAVASWCNIDVTSLFNIRKILGEEFTSQGLSKAVQV